MQCTRHGILLPTAEFTMVYGVLLVVLSCIKSSSKYPFSKPQVSIAGYYANRFPVYITLGMVTQTYNNRHLFLIDQILYTHACCVEDFSFTLFYFCCNSTHTMKDIYSLLQINCILIHLEIHLFMSFLGQYHLNTYRLV